MKEAHPGICGSLLGLILLAAFLPQCASKEERVSVLLISIDTLRPDHLGCYGYPRATSANIDALASEGVLFETAISSSSWTLPAHMALFTSLLDSLHGVTDNGMSLPEGISTLASVLKEAGFRTAAVISGPYLHSAFGFSRGFDDYINVMDFFPKGAGHAVVPPEEVHLKSHKEVTSPQVTDAAIRWLESTGSTPFFLFLHYFDVHYDFLPPGSIVESFDPGYEGPVTGKNFLSDGRIRKGMAQRDFHRLIALYDGEIWSVDHQIGRVLEALRRKGLLDKILVGVTSDHGEEFFEHGEKGHRKNLFDTVLRIPLIFRLPGRIEAGRRVGGQVRIIDISPTILDLLGIPSPGDTWMGRSLLPFMEERGSRGDGEPSREQVPQFPVFSELVLPSSGMDIRALRLGRYKGIWDRIKGQAFFFDLQEDPGEQNPQLAQKSVTFKKIEEKLLAMVRDLKESAPKPGRARLDSRTLQRLKELGYLVGEGGADERPH